MRTATAVLGLALVALVAGGVLGWQLATPVALGAACLAALLGAWQFTQARRARVSSRQSSGSPGRRISRRALLIAAGGGLVAFAAVALRLQQPTPAAPGGSGRLSDGPPRVSTPGTGDRRRGLWIPPDELAGLPTDTPAFRRLRDAAERDIDVGDITDQDSHGSIHTMATALVAARLDDDRLRASVRDALLALIGTEGGSTGGHPDRNRPLGIGRNLPGFVLAADLIEFRAFDASAERRFRPWLDRLRTLEIRGAGYSLAEAEPLDHSNWGAYQGAAITAANIYLQDRSAIERSAHILRGWLGDRDGSQEWEYDTDRHDYSWQCHYPDVDRFLPVNPAGCERDGFELSGVIPIDMQRGDGFRVPPSFTRYPRESLQGRTIQGEMLFQAGYPVWEWADRAFWRIAERQLHMAESFRSDWFEPQMGCYWVLAARYAEHLPLEEPATGRSVAGVDWTHARH